MQNARARIKSASHTPNSAPNRVPSARFAGHVHGSAAIRASHSVVATHGVEASGRADVPRDRRPTARPDGLRSLHTMLQSVPTPRDELEMPTLGRENLWPADEFGMLRRSTD
jgi:hypothetical protein